MRKLSSFIITLSFLGVLFLAGCATVEKKDSATSAKGPTAEKPIKWVAQSPWPTSLSIQWQAEEIAKTITKASGGRLIVEMHPAGAIVPALDILDAVNTGTLDAIHSWEGYWMGKNPAAGFFAAMPLGMNEQEYATWVLYGGGKELWQECFKDYNVKVLPAGAYTPEILYHSKKPIRNLNDLKGTKVRGVGFWGDIQARLGASVVAVAGGECYQALERGVVDAIEFASPSDNFKLGYHEIAPYLVVPGIHQPTSMFSFIVNKKKWDELPEDLKKTVELACESMWGKAYAYSAHQDMQVMAKYRDLVKQGKLTIIEFEPESQKKVKEVADAYYKEKAAKDPFFAKVLESQQKFLADYKPWRKFMTPQY